MKRTSTLPYFQVDSGQVLLASMGRTHEEMGIYLMLLAMYWENDCRLPPKERLIAALQAKGKKKQALLEQVIAAFFPDGVNAHLDQCKANATTTSQRNAANAKKGHAKRGNPEEIPENSQSSEFDGADF